MVTQGNAYQFGDKLTFEEKLTFLTKRNLPYFLDNVYTPSINSNPLVRGSGKNKELNEVKIKEYISAFVQLFKLLLDLREGVIVKYGKKSQEFENIFTLLNSVIEINQQLPKMTHLLVVKNSFFRRKDDRTPAIKVKGNLIRTVKLYETVLGSLGS